MEKSKLSIVRDFLREKSMQDIAVIAEWDSASGPDKQLLHLGYSPDFWIAPRMHGGLYTAERLQNFMLELIPDNLTPNYQRDFEKSNDYLTFGHLRFDEKIGEETTTTHTIIKTSDERFQEEKEGFNEEGIQDYNSTRNIEYMRRIFIRPLPSIDYAVEAVLGYHRHCYKYDIREASHLETLRKYQEIPGMLELHLYGDKDMPGLRKFNDY